jgi:limonene 1,2-monooxygenase
MSRLRFGIFLAPFHPAGENPTRALQRDLDLICHLDRARL